MKKYVCNVCGWVFDEAQGGSFQNLPEDFQCPLCGVDKSHFFEE